MFTFKGEVKPSVPCSKILRHVEDSFSYNRDTERQNWTAILGQFLPASLLSFSAETRAESCGDELGMIRTQMGSKMTRIWSQLNGTLCKIPLRNSNQ
jgi:hypothetical protein